MKNHSKIWSWAESEGSPLANTMIYFFLKFWASIMMVLCWSYVNIYISEWRHTPFLYVTLSLSYTLVFLFIWVLGKAFLINLGTIFSGQRGKQKPFRCIVFYSGNVNPEETEPSVSQWDPKSIPIQEETCGLGHFL